MGKVNQQEQEAQPEPVQPELAEPKQAEAPPPKYRFQVLADREARWTESQYWSDFPIGHAWVRMIDPSGQVDSWGYWPDLAGGPGVDPSAPWKSVPGQVHHPEDPHALSPQLTYEYEIEEEAAHKVMTAANGKVAWPGMYNLFTYNCTTFAVEMAKVAGVSPPSPSVLGIMNPDTLHAGIAAMNEKVGSEAAEPAADAAEPS